MIIQVPVYKFCSRDNGCFHNKGNSNFHRLDGTGFQKPVVLWNPPQDLTTVSKHVKISAES